MHTSQRVSPINTQSRGVHRKKWTMSTNRSIADSDSSVRAGILANVPSLRAFAISLSGNIDRADDLVQDTLLRALAKIDSFESRTNLPSPFCASH